MDTDPFFEKYYENARVNCMLIMDPKGIVIKVNSAFTQHFGYNTDDLNGKSFAVLFTAKDIAQNKPALEITQVLATGQGNDDNYVVHKDGHHLLCSGESILTNSRDGKQYIVKDIVNMQAKKYLKMFLTETEELLERIFESSKDIAMVVLDGSMRIIKINAAFHKLFELSHKPQVGDSLASLKNIFWNRADVREQIRSVIVSDTPLKLREFICEDSSGEQKIIHIDSMILDKGMGKDKKIYIMIEEQHRTVSPIAR